MRLSRFRLQGIAWVIAGFLVSVGVGAPVSNAAFGTSPPWVRNDHLLPGTTYEQIVNLSRSEADMAMRVNTRVEGDKEIVKWLSIEDQDNLVMQKGQKILPMKVSVKVPRRAAIKEYRGGIFVTLESIIEEGQQGGEVAIKLGAHILVEITVVGESVTDYRIRSVSLAPMIQGDAFSLGVEVENLGNTDITDLTGQIDVYNDKETEVLKTVAFGKLADTVSPDSVVRTHVDFPDLLLDEGGYWIAARIFRGDTVIYENRLRQLVGPPAVVESEVAENGAAKKPGIPKTETVEPAATEQEVVTSSPEEVLRPAAQGNRWFVVIGVAGFVFGLVSLVAIIFLLVFLIKSQRQAAIQRYLSGHQSTNE